jgi:hypothetical protein
MKNLIKVLCLSTLVFTWACNSPEPVDEAVVDEPVDMTESTTAVVNHHLEAFGSNNMEELMADYTDESVLMTPDGNFTGLAEIQGLFEQVLPMFPTEGTEFVLDKMVVDNNLAYLVWRANTPVVEAELATDTFIIEDGKIIRQTFAGLIEPVEEGEEEDDEKEDA